MTGLQVTFSARVARKARSTTSASGIHRTRVNVDIPQSSDRYDGEIKHTWVTIAATGDLGELLKTLEVGDRIYVEGGLRLGSYEKDGRPMIGINVNASYVTRVREEPVEAEPGPTPAARLVSRARARVMAEPIPEPPEPPAWLRDRVHRERGRERDRRRHLEREEG